MRQSFRSNLFRFLRYFLPSALTLLWIVFIFSNSLKNGVESGNQSAHLLDIVNSLLRFLGFDGSISESALRSFAHFAEFAILAFLFCSDLFFYGLISFFKSAKVSILLCSAILPLSALFALFDEFLQLFSGGRASQLTDVLIDTSGAALAILLFLLLFFLARKYYLKKKEAP